MANFEGGGVAVQTCSRARNNADIVTSRSINFEIIAEKRFMVMFASSILLAAAAEQSQTPPKRQPFLLLSISPRRRHHIRREYHHQFLFSISNNK